eukprot:357138-Chlamydomonas_euryale.AAC.1
MGRGSAYARSSLAQPEPLPQPYAEARGLLVSVHTYQVWPAEQGPAHHVLRRARSGTKSHALCCARLRASVWLWAEPCTGKYISRTLYVVRAFAQVCDFGLSRIQEHTSHTGREATAAWTAPEVHRMERCTEKIDVYSYGIVLWELVTGMRPWVGHHICAWFRWTCCMGPPQFCMHAVARGIVSCLVAGLRMAEQCKGWSWRGTLITLLREACLLCQTVHAAASANT